MQVLGLTGKTGAGKSTVALLLKDMGCFIIDGDVLSRTITKKGSPILPELQKVFGEDILDDKGELIRQRLAQRAFSSRENTQKLNGITHPEIKRLCAEEIKKAEKLGFSCCIIDAAALLDSDCRDLCQKIIVVTAEEETRLQRILRRDGISRSEAMLRIKAQKDDEYYLSNADYILRNYPPYDLEKEVSSLRDIIK